MADEYVLGTGDDELARLGFQHSVWADAAAALWTRAGFGHGQTLLDLGCGPGYAALDLARIGARVIAIDESDRFVRHLRSVAPPNVDARVGDVCSLDLPTSSLDGAYARWVLCFVREPDRAVAGVARALKPGGVLAVQDYFNYTSMTPAPRSEPFARVVDAIARAWRARGGDPDIVGRLPAMCTAAGLSVREIVPHLRVARPGSRLWEWPDSFFRNFVPTLVRTGFLTEREQADFFRDWDARSHDPDAFYCIPPVFDLIAVKS